MPGIGSLRKQASGAGRFLRRGAALLWLSLHLHVALLRLSLHLSAVLLPCACLWHRVKIRSVLCPGLSRRIRHPPGSSGRRVLRFRLYGRIPRTRHIRLSAILLRLLCLL